MVSCNTTSTVRTLGVRKADLLKKARGVLIHQATDPSESDHSGVMNTVVPETTIPFHQGPDAQTVDPELDVVTIAVVAAHTNSQLRSWIVELTREALDRHSDSHPDRTGWLNLLESSSVSRYFFGCNGVNEETISILARLTAGFPTRW